ncbi:MAG: HD-GYP domain-containing protein [Treponema sp.]|nr:HD-GYP domain-containing protein [Treponema sp.]
MRVAEYAREIARRAKKSEAEIREIYFSALLHDVGKIGVPDAIINKEGRLTDEEFQAIKEHPKLGNQILQNIRQSPYISIGAHYHHERYDGHGYPEGLKGEEIPEIARIIAVADTYDAMTSKRSYRSTLPQEVVRDEIEKGIGTQFDPQYAKIMLEMIDEDKDYQMQEWKAPFKRISGVMES